MKIAIIEDDILQRTTLHSWLEDAGHHCDDYSSGLEFIEQGQQADYQLMLFDWGLPGLSGIELLGWLRAQQQDNTPVIFVTAHDAEERIVEALRHGADDYLVKPARRQELLARVDALFRRVVPEMAQTLHSFGNIKVDTQRQEMVLDGDVIELTQKEFSLALYLLENSGKLVSRNELLEKVWGHSHNLHTRTVDTHISRLRKKLRLTRENGWHLGAVYQYGYRLDYLCA